MLPIAVDGNTDYIIIMIHQLINAVVLYSNGKVYKLLSRKFIERKPSAMISKSALG